MIFSYYHINKMLFLIILIFVSPAIKSDELEDKIIKKYFANNIFIEIIDPRFDNDKRIIINLDNKKIKESTDQNIKKKDFNNQDKAFVPDVVTPGYKSSRKAKLPENMDKVFIKYFESFVEKGEEDLFLKVHVLEANQYLYAEGIAYFVFKIETKLQVIINDQNGNVLLDKIGNCILIEKYVAGPNSLLDTLYLSSLKRSFYNAIMEE